MIDFNLNIQRETEIWHLLFFLFFYLIAYVTNNRYINSRIPLRKVYNFKGRLLYLCIIVLCIFAYNRGDFYHYANFVQNYSSDFDSHIEYFYIWLVKILNNNYFAWRVVVWCSALFILFKTCKRLEISEYYSFAILLICFINIFNYARASLAFSVYFFGVSFILKPINNNIISYLIGIFIILSCSFFHSSATMLIFITILLAIPINRKTFCIIIIALIFLLNNVYDLVVGYMDNYEGDSNLSVKFNNYNISNDTSIGIALFINNTLRYSMYFISFLIISMTLFKLKFKICKFIKGLYKLLATIVTFSIMFLLYSNSDVLFYRTLYMSTIPICMILAYLYSESYISSKTFSFCIYLGLVGVLYDSIYNIYLLSLG